MSDEQTTETETGNSVSVVPSEAVQPEPVQSEPTPVEVTPPPVIPPIIPAEPTPVTPAPATPVPTPAPVPASSKSFLVRALEKIQFRKRAKLAKIVAFAQGKKSITNDQVEKLLHVSDATAGRYLRELVAQGKLHKTGTASGTRYEPTT